jgi:hypothetical protein
MTTAPAGKRLLRLKKLSTTQRNARERRASRLKPCAGTSAAAMKKLRTPSRSRLKKLSFRSRLKKLRSTQGSASERRASCLKPCSRLNVCYKIENSVIKLKIQLNVFLGNAQGRR